MPTTPPPHALAPSAAPAPHALPGASAARPAPQPDSPPTAARRLARAAATLALTALLAACGGGGGGSAGGTEPPVAAPPPPATTPPPAPVVERPATRSQAMRFLTQATFGPTEADIARLTAIGYAAWIDEQFARPASGHRVHWESRDAALRAAGGRSGTDQVTEAFWKHALTGDDQLRQRVAFAWSQIFVISMEDGSVGNNPRAAAAWMDLLATEGLGDYRTLLEGVSRHPMMGVYLSHLRNQKANATTGRVPDENYAREVMQLFSIGLVALEEDGSVRAAGGQPVETYGPDDVSGLARVFTGWSWACPSWPDNGCFSRGTVDGASDPDRTFKPMLGYPQYHSPEEKRFLGVTVPAQTVADPAASLAVALDRLAAHPNVGPFIGRQLIQRLVTSNPSPAYVRAVSRVWADNGSGRRGDLRAVVKAILMHPEARQMSDTSGKLREPVLRLAAFLRAFGHTSDSGAFRVGNTDNPANALGQTPLRAPSVFNFWRPGYAAPGTQSAAAGLVAPELQVVHETSVAGYVNYMRDAVSRGVGATNGTIAGVVLNRRDLQADYSAELALAAEPAALVDRVADKLLYEPLPAALRDEIVAAVGSIALSGSASAIETARRNRVNTALLLVLASPEYQVQR
jgi:uncharacterized protein (DUF1800 family)